MKTTPISVPIKFGDIPIRLDDSIPMNEIRFVDSDGRVLGVIKDGHVITTPRCGQVASIDLPVAVASPKPTD